MTTSKCRSCGAEIMWIETKKGKKMPLDAEPLHQQELDPKLTYATFTDTGEYRCYKGDEIAVLSKPLYTSHFATCPQSDDWRSKPKSEGKKMLEEKVAASKLFRARA